MNTFNDKLFEVVKDVAEVKTTVEEIRNSNNVSPAKYYLYSSDQFHLNNKMLYYKWGYMKIHNTNRHNSDCAKITVVTFLIDNQGSKQDIGCYFDSFINHITNPDDGNSSRISIQGITHLKHTDLTAEVVLKYEQPFDGGDWYSLYLHFITENTGLRISPLIELICKNDGIKLYSSMTDDDERPEKAKPLSSGSSNFTSNGEKDIKYTATTTLQEKITALEERITALEGT